MPFELSVVDRGAVRVPFLVIKSEGGTTQMEITDEVRKALETMGFDPSKMSEDSDEVEAAKALVQKAIDASDETNDDESLIKQALAPLLALIDKLPKGFLAGKSADDSDKEKPAGKPEVDPEVAKARDELAEERKRFQAERTELRVEKALGRLEDVAKASKIVPATRDAIAPIVEHLARTDVEHITKSEDGETKEPMADVLIKAFTHETNAIAPLMAEIGSAGSEGASDPWDKLAPASAGGNGTEKTD